jgi:hypothetical protein
MCVDLCLLNVCHGDVQAHKTGGAAAPTAGTGGSGGGASSGGGGVAPQPGAAASQPATATDADGDAASNFKAFTGKGYSLK